MEVLSSEPREDPPPTKRQKTTASKETSVKRCTLVSHADCLLQALYGEWEDATRRYILTPSATENAIDVSTTRKGDTKRRKTQALIVAAGTYFDERYVAWKGTREEFWLARVTANKAVWEHVSRPTYQFFWSRV